MADEKPREETDSTQEESTAKPKPPILSYLIIFVVSTVITIVVSTLYFSNLQKKQVKFMKTLSVAKSVDSRMESTTKPSSKPKGFSPTFKLVTSWSKEGTMDTSSTIADTSDTAVVGTETGRYPVEQVETDTIGRVDTSEIISEIEDKVVAVAVAKKEQPEEELPETPKVLNINKTLKIIKSMKTSQSVELLSQFDDDTILLFLSKMRERDAAKILAALPPERAFKLTQMMLEQG